MRHINVANDHYRENITGGFDPESMKQTYDSGKEIICVLLFFLLLAIVG